MSATVMYRCGCSIESEMAAFGGGIRSVGHCEQHKHLFSQDKTLRQMADEIHDAVFGKAATQIAIAYAKVEE